MKRAGIIHFRLFYIEILPPTIPFKRGFSLYIENPAISARPFINQQITLAASYFPVIIVQAKTLWRKSVNTKERCPVLQRVFS